LKFKIEINIVINSQHKFQKTNLFNVVELAISEP